MASTSANVANVVVSRLRATDLALARSAFQLMASVFDELYEAPSDAYLRALLEDSSFWALVATAGDPHAVRSPTVIGCLTAHSLPMTKREGRELFLYDIAVDASRQRLGIGRQLVDALRQLGRAAEIEVVFVAADIEDQHALDFYRTLGAVSSAVTMFVFEDH